MKRYESASGLGLIRQAALYEEPYDAIVWLSGRPMFVPRKACLLNIVDFEQDV